MMEVNNFHQGLEDYMFWVVFKIVFESLAGFDPRS